MKTLTREQAQQFRAIRRHLHSMARDTEEIATDCCGWCPHDGEDSTPVDPECPVCKLWDDVREAANALERAALHLDVSLRDGPTPR